MSIKASIKIGTTTIQVESETQRGLVEEAAFWNGLPTKCGNCQGEEVGFFERRPKGNLYLGLQCKGCEYRLNFGQNQEGGKLFLKWDTQWEAPFHKDENTLEAPETGPEDDDSEDEIPFT